MTQWLTIARRLALGFGALLLIVACIVSFILFGIYQGEVLFMLVLGGGANVPTLFILMFMTRKSAPIQFGFATGYLGLVWLAGVWYFPHTQGVQGVSRLPSAFEAPVWLVISTVWFGLFALLMFRLAMDKSNLHYWGDRVTNKSKASHC